jgi:branched-chain amino acid transport system substrate-binding protein
MNRISVFLFCVFLPFQALAEEKVLRLYHDADWLNHVESAESIWRGVETALSEDDHNVQGYRIELIKKNHSGNVVRSLANYEAFLKDDLALAVISGIHSPPLIKNRKFINENKALTLVPWAAGGPITRYPSKENWVFRLSVDDTKAGKVLVEYALNVKGCKATHLLLEDTSWGNSNLRNIKTALAKRGEVLNGVTRFNWNLKGYTARNKLLEISKGGADCVLLVANAIEGAEIAEAMLALGADNRLPIISHWGITAGDFHEKFNAEKRTKVDITFIQSCFSFIHTPLSKKGKEIFNKARLIFPDHIKEPRDIRSPVGFIHGYDITKLFIIALKSIEITEDMPTNRNKVRLALENIQESTEGLIKNYKKPFGIFSKSNPDAHEALGSNDYCMAHYGSQNEIIVLKQ